MVELVEMRSIYIYTPLPYPFVPACGSASLNSKISQQTFVGIRAEEDTGIQG